jgi:rsbT co-antagonist protein RsbR
MASKDMTKEQLMNELAEARQRIAELEVEAQAPKAKIGGINLEWDMSLGTFTFEQLPVIMAWVDTTLAGLMSGMQAMVGTERFNLALQSEGRKSVEADWEVIAQFPTFPEGFAAIAGIAAVAGWGKWEIVEFDQEKQLVHFRVGNSWEGGYQKALGVYWGSGMLAGKMAGYCTKLFNTNCWAEQTAFIAKGDEYDEFVVQPSDRSVEAEVEKLLATDEATRADLAVALQKLRAEMSEREKVEAERERLQQEIIEAQQHALKESATPVIPIMDRIIVMPLIGSIDSLRARDITRALLTGISQHRAKVVILDVTGVGLMDTGIVNHLNKTIQAARLKGAETIVTGISDSVAEAIVDLGIDWSGIETLSDLQTGLVHALDGLGIKLQIANGK